MFEVLISQVWNLMERWTILTIAHSIYLIDIKAHINFIGFSIILLFRHTLSMVLLVNKK